MITTKFTQVLDYILWSQSFFVSFKYFLLSGLAEYDASKTLEFLVVDDDFRVGGIQVFRFLKIFSCLAVILEGFDRESSSEVGIGIFGVALDDFIEILLGFLVALYHLVGLGALVVVLHFREVELDTLRKRKDRLLIFLQVAVRQPNMVINVCIARWLRIVL